MYENYLKFKKKSNIHLKYIQIKKIKKRGIIKI